MSKIPFLIKHGFNITTKFKDSQGFIEMTPKRNFWFFLFCFVTSFEIMVTQIKTVEIPGEDNVSINE